VRLEGIKKRLDAAKGNWSEQLYHVLWSYHTTIQSSTGETPFRLTYGADAVIPVEIGEPSWRTTNPPENNEALLRENIDMIDEIREAARLKELARK